MMLLQSSKRISAMASITIRNLDDELKARLRLRAAQHGHSMEEEVRGILRQILSTSADASLPLAQRIHDRFAAVYQQHGAVDELPIPARRASRPAPNLG
jgi:plasmid stability protein